MHIISSVNNKNVEKIGRDFKRKIDFGTKYLRLSTKLNSGMLRKLKCKHSYKKKT